MPKDFCTKREYIVKLSPNGDRDRAIHSVRARQALFTSTMTRRRAREFHTRRDP